MTRKTPKNILAINAAAPAIPEKPSNATANATIKKNRPVYQVNLLDGFTLAPSEMEINS
jgi:hypothetical protein